MPAADDGHVTAFHATLSEYIKERQPSELNVWSINHITGFKKAARVNSANSDTDSVGVAGINTYLFVRSLSIMQGNLQFNIAGFETSFITNENHLKKAHVKARLQASLSSGLAYACLHCFEHWLLSAKTAFCFEQLLLFYRSRLWFWLEVLSICRNVEEGAIITRKLAKDVVNVRIILSDEILLIFTLNSA
jgi:hypothetical protein